EINTAGRPVVTPRLLSADSSAFMIRTPIVPWIWAPHQSNGTGGTTLAAISFLTSRFPTWGPFPWVSTTWAPDATMSATSSMATVMAARWSSGLARPSGLVIALPPRAISTRTRQNSSGGRRSRLLQGGLVQPAPDRIAVLVEQRRCQVLGP